MGKVREFFHCYVVAFTPAGLFRHRDWSGATMLELCRMFDAYLRYGNEGRPGEKLGWMGPMRYRRSPGGEGKISWTPS